MRSDRLLAILLLLQTRGRCTAPDLAEELEVSVRTIYRDVDALSSAGVPVYTEQGRGGGILLLPGYRTDATGLTAHEAQALFTFSGRGVLTDPSTDGHLQAAFRKLLAALPVEQRPAAERTEQRILVEPQGWGRRTETVPHLGVLQQAVISDRQVRVRYRRPGREPSEYTLDPVGLVSKAGTWYLVACREGEPRMYRAGRVEHAELGDAAALPPDLPPLARLWDQMRSEFERPGTGLTVEVRVAHARSAGVMRGAAGQVTAEPERRPDPDHPGDDIVSLMYRNAQHARWSLLGYCAEHEVVGPPEVREELAESARAILARYG